jgi:hypothetical protein
LPRHQNFQFGVASTIFATNLEDARNILTWARTRKLDIVFNMLRFTDAMLNNKELETSIGFQAREEAFMREFFLERVQEESVLSGQAFLYLHYAEMIANGYQRTMPCPFQTQGLLLNPYGDLHFCENSQAIGNVLTTRAEELYFKAESLAHREDIVKTICPTCLSPCQVNVGAMKQVVPYAKFLMRAYHVKHDSARAVKNVKTLPTPQPDSASRASGIAGASARGASRRRLRPRRASGGGRWIDRVHPVEESPARSPGCRGRCGLAAAPRRRSPGSRRSRTDGLSLDRAALHT